MLLIKKILFCMTCILLCVLFPSACREDVSPPHTIRVGFSQPDSHNPWRTAQINSFIEATANCNMELVYTEPNLTQPGWQSKAIQHLLDIPVDYLVIVPSEKINLTQILKVAKQKRIPVILGERDLSNTPGTDYATLIRADYFREGQLCAQLLANQFGEKPCAVLELSGTESAALADDRIRGFESEMAKHHNFQIIARAEGGTNRIEAQKSTSQAIINGVKFDAVFAQTDEDGLGALQALKIAGISPEKDVKIVSIGGVQDVLKAIIAKEYLATIESSPKLGFIAVDIIDQIERGFTPPPLVVIPYQIYDRDNAFQLFDTAF